MSRFGITAILFLVASYQVANAKPPAQCAQLGVDGKASSPLTPVGTPKAKSCNTRRSGEFPIPDPACTPGAVDPTVTLAVLTSKKPKFVTDCVRNVVTSEGKKGATYLWYNYKYPTNNSGATQTCELDHLIPLEIGGADTLDNIWPQCGPKGVTFTRRYFHRKDTVEKYLATQVKAGKMTLEGAQKGVASDWTQYLDDAEKSK